MSAERDPWLVEASAVDPAAFQLGRVGAFSLGRRLRRNAFGEVLIARHDTGGFLVELELYDVIARGPLAGAEARIMADIAEAAAVDHRLVARIVGSGIIEGVPYVARPHRLGRTLEALLGREGSVEAELGAALTHAASAALEHLAEAGAHPGSCAMGGFEADDLFLGFDGSISLLGVGLKRARPGTGAGRDLAALFALARRLDERCSARLGSTLGGVSTLADATRALRKRHAEACGRAALHTATALRAAFAAEIAEERAFFGLPTLQ